MSKSVLSRKRIPLCQKLTNLKFLSCSFLLVSLRREISSTFLWRIPTGKRSLLWVIHNFHPTLQNDFWHLRKKKSGKIPLIDELHKSYCVWVSWLTISEVIKFINQSNSKSVRENKTQSLTRKKRRIQVSKI